MKLFKFSMKPLCDVIGQWYTENIRQINSFVTGITQWTMASVRPYHVREW